jgi:UDP-N-acetylmuramate dehydrogenase
MTKLQKNELKEGLSDIVGLENVFADEPMKRHTTFRVGGNADFLVTPTGMDQIIELIGYLKGIDVKYYPIGNGSNLLVKDDGVRGVVIKLHRKMGDITISNNLMVCGAGALMPRIAGAARDNSLTGFEFACGIPGTIGGAVVMNAGAYGGEIKDVVISTTYVDPDGTVRKIEGENHQFGYRKSYFTNKKSIIAEVVLKLAQGDIHDIRAKMMDFTVRRKDKQPLDKPNAGSIFKRPEGHFVGPMITEAGLKGKKIGGASVSTKHAGFIVNDGDATCQDILDLVKFIQETIMKKYNVELESELRLIG